MVIKFWGVRGSLPTPITSAQIQSKISAVVQRITVEDLISQDSRERFVASLPEWQLGTYGGNTACMTVTGGDGTVVICDAGSGMRVLGREGKRPRGNHYNLVLSHFHWDHIQGLPFFAPLFDERVTMDVYSAKEDARELLSAQMSEPYFPVSFENVAGRMSFHTVVPGQEYEIGQFVMHCCPMKHPGGSMAYSFVEKGGDKKAVYATDVELNGGDFDSDKDGGDVDGNGDDTQSGSSGGGTSVGDNADADSTAQVFAGADTVVLDSQYTVSEAYEKGGWGHSAFCYAVDAAARWNVKNLYLFHHEPTYDDRKLGGILDTARWYAGYIERTDVNVYLAREGLEVNV